MKFKKSLLTLALASAAAGVHAAPVMQTCAPLEVQTGTTGLNYSMRCEAGPWKLTYSGAVPSGDDTMSVQYRLDAQGPGSSNMAQSRTAVLPSAAKLGQVLAREAVLLDSGDLALRDCRDLNCTKYRPVTGTSFIPQQATQLPASGNPYAEDRARAQQYAATAPSKPYAAPAPSSGLFEVKSSADQEISKRLKDTLDQVSQLRAEKVQAEDKARTDVRAAEAKLQLELKTEREAAEGRVAAARAAATRDGETAANSLRVRIRDLEAEIGRLNATLAQAAKDKDLAIKDRETSVEMSRSMAAELSSLKRTSADHGAALQAQRSAYEFALASLVAQHNEQVANLTRMMPEMNFRGVVEDLKVPKVSVNGQAPVASHTPDVMRSAPQAAPVKVKSSGAPAAPAPKAEKKQAEPEPKASATPRSSVFGMR